MMDAELSGRVEKNLMVFKIIWGAMLCTLAIYLFVGTYLSGKIAVGPKDPKTFATLRAALYAVSLATLVATRIVRSRLLAKGAQVALAQRREGKDAVSPAPVLAMYGVVVVTSLAMSESIGIYGLVLSLLGTGTTDLLVLLGVAAAAMVYHRPRTDEVLELMKGRSPGGTV